MATSSYTLRITAGEKVAINKASQVLDLTPSQLIQNAAVEAAHRLGFFDSLDVPMRRSRTWKDAPRRTDESTSIRLTISFLSTNEELIKRAAEYVRTEEGEPISVAQFCVGATLRYIANKRKSLPKDSEAAAKLKSLFLPSEYA